MRERWKYIDAPVFFFFFIAVQGFFAVCVHDKSTIVISWHSKETVFQANPSASNFSSPQLTGQVQIAQEFTASADSPAYLPLVYTGNNVLLFTQRGASLPEEMPLLKSLQQAIFNCLECCSFFDIFPNWLSCLAQLFKSQ